MIDNECCNELTKMNKNDEIPSKDLEVLEKISKKDKNYEDHACYELHLGYSEKQMQKQVYGPYNEKKMVKKYENLVAFHEAYEQRTKVAQEPLPTVRSPGLKPEFSTKPTGLLKRVTFEKAACHDRNVEDKAEKRRGCPPPRPQCSKPMSWVNDDGGLVNHRLGHKVGPKGNQ